MKGQGVVRVGTRVTALLAPVRTVGRCCHRLRPRWARWKQCRAKRVCLADYDVARGSVGAWYCSDSAERRSNRTMSNRVKQRCIIQDVHLFTSIYST